MKKFQIKFYTILARYIYVILRQDSMSSFHFKNRYVFFYWGGRNEKKFLKS